MRRLAGLQIGPSKAEAVVTDLVFPALWTSAGGLHREGDTKSDGMLVAVIFTFSSIVFTAISVSWKVSAREKVGLGLFFRSCLM